MTSRMNAAPQSRPRCRAQRGRPTGSRRRTGTPRARARRRCAPSRRRARAAPRAGTAGRSRCRTARRRRPRRRGSRGRGARRRSRPGCPPRRRRAASRAAPARGPSRSRAGGRGRCVGSARSSRPTVGVLSSPGPDASGRDSRSVGAGAGSTHFAVVLARPVLVDVAERHAAQRVARRGVQHGEVEVARRRGTSGSACAQSCTITVPAKR